MISRPIARIALAAAVLVIALAALLWARPEFLGALRALEVWMPPAMDPAFRGQAEGRKTGQPLVSETEWIDDGWCATHDRPESECEICRAEPEPSDRRSCLEKLPMIRLSGPGVAQRIGLALAPVIQREHADTLIGNAEIAYDANTYAEVRPRVSGFIREVLGDEGQQVSKGQVLLVIDTAEVGSAKASYLGALPVVELAQATLERTRSLTRSSALPLKDELVAQTELNRARADLLNSTQRLKNLGFTDEELAGVAKSQDTSSLLRVQSPVEGTVVSRHAVNGEAVEPNTQVFVVADIRLMWAWIDVYEREIEQVAAGQGVRFWIGGADDRPFQGAVDWIDAAVNPATRTIRVRARLANPDGRLRANQFGRAEILVGKPHQAIFIPREAVQMMGDQPLVFVPASEGHYRPQRVVIEPGERLNDEVEILWGVKAGESVVTTGGFQLKSEMLKDQLAGD